jgi:putative RecB family exonuclease
VLWHAGGLESYLEESQVHRQDNQVRGSSQGRRFSTDRPHWSYSQVSQFLRCPLQFYFERVVKLPKPFISSGLVLGASVHQALAEFHLSIQREIPLGPEQLRQVVVRTWEEMENREPIQYRDGEDRTKSLDQAVALVELYAKEPVPDCVVAVEEPLLVPLFNSQGEALEKPLLAIPDLLIRDKEGLWVTEFKTSGRRFGETETESSLQASCYTHAVQDRYGEQPRVRYTVLVKTKTPQIQHLETIRNDADINRLGDIVQAVERAIEAEVFYPIESQMTCSGCSFFKSCREWQGCPRRKSESLESHEQMELARC